MPKTTRTRSIELLLSDYRRRILGLLLLRPEEQFHVREIARLTRIPAGSLHRELKTLAEGELLEREPAGNQVRYRANRSSPIYPELAGILRKTSGLVDVLREALKQLGSAVQIAFVFGSVAKGEEHGTSDIDVMVIGKSSFQRVVAALLPLQAQLGREVNPVVMTLVDFSGKRDGGDRFVTRVLREPKLFVIGTEDDLGKLAQDRSAKGTRA
ncbi:MAG: nucleotidyltransferase domain-containing protein [Gammaproteobacteria bacterium]